ncbi:HigA family addiction module antitoxin [Allochromatium vinosum]|uniref:Plasmid maintenance system antidote protein, XRE family n=1 Tax=Allochromatium vinosum (strain ATCC 17899 / DSM 180 / NBRC 103801 / NCIMB 10441 / D) TaxID=572477 RepID=D3RRR7_ALLVD|nr:HigA family addiction module antitoxin [Allochromatium vinosum]ADC61971.1 plasmid maintenance system antidote protein, XRE family [Allochromatium vinosum DSM 180]MBK1655171.1 addiction module antidote protein, HigA family [Allochromatium vinosum]
MTEKLPPIHPGEILREEFMQPLGLSCNALARAMGVTPARINEIVRERRGVSAETALRLARVFGTSVDLWMNLQQRYELECAKDALGDALEKIKPIDLAA